MVASSLNLLPLPLPSLSTTNAFASASASTSTFAQSATTTMKSIGGHILSRPMPRGKKMLSIGVEAMRNMVVTDSSSAANFFSIQASPFKHEPELEHRFNDDDVDGTFRSTINNRKTILSIPLSTPMMHMMPDLTTPTPTTARKSSTRRSSTSSIVSPRKRVGKTKKTELSNNAQAQLPVLSALQVPTKRMKKAVCQIEKGLFVEFLSSKNQQQQPGSGRMSTTVSTSTSTSSLILATPQPQKEESIYNEVLTPTIMLKPRIRMFQEEGEEQQQEQQVTMIEPAAPWPTAQSSSLSFQQKDVTEAVEVTTATITEPTPFALSASLNKALSMLSVDSNYGDDTQDDDDDDDALGVFVSFGEDDNDHKYINNSNYDCYSPLDNSSYLPVFIEGHWKQDNSSYLPVFIEGHWK